MGSVQHTIQEVKFRRQRKVTWTPETVDNEHMNKKSSKICCIFHKEGHTGCKNKNKYDRA